MAINPFEDDMSLYDFMPPGWTPRDSLDPSEQGRGVPMGGFVDAQPPGPDFSESEIPLPRQLPAPAPTMPQMPPFEPEQAPYLPRQGGNPLLPFLLDTLASARFYGRGPGAIAPGIAFAGLQAFARRRAAKGKQDEDTRTELNSRFKLAAAERNRQNLAASGRAYSGRIAELKAESARQRDLNEKHDPVLGPGDVNALGLPIGRAGKRISQLTEEERQKIAPKVGWVTIPTAQGPKTVPATSTAAQNAGITAPTPPRATKAGAMKMGPVMPSLSALESKLGQEAQNARSFGRSAAADSLTKLSGAVKGVHARLREAQTTAQVDSIPVPPGMDQPTMQELARAARLRKEQIGNPR